MKVEIDGELIESAYYVPSTLPHVIINESSTKWIDSDYVESGYVESGPGYLIFSYEGENGNESFIRVISETDEERQILKCQRFENNSKHQRTILFVEGHYLRN